jgi:hypothetical protein
MSVMQRNIKLWYYLLVSELLSHLQFHKIRDGISLMVSSTICSHLLWYT